MAVMPPYCTSLNKDLRLQERQSLLEKVVGNSGVLLSQPLPGTLSQIFQAVKLHGLEGGRQEARFKIPAR